MSTPEELPIVAWRTRFRSEPGMIGHYPWTYTERAYRANRPEVEWEPLAVHATATAAIAQLRTELEASQLECEKLRVDAERWRFASTSRNFGISFWSGFGNGTVYGRLATDHIDAAMKKDCT